MSDPLTIVAGTLTALKAAYETVKVLKDADKAFMEANYKAQLSEVYMTLADAREGIAGLKTAIREKDEEIEVLRKKLTLTGVVRWGEPFYWREEGEKITGPFFSRCWDKDMTLVRVTFEGRYSFWDLWQCPNCNQQYRDHQKTAQNKKS